MTDDEQVPTLVSAGKLAKPLGMRKNGTNYREVTDPPHCL